jgi:hypothetical protein
MKSRLLLIVLGAFFFFSNCSKDKVGGSDLKLSKIYSNGQLQSVFSYNSTGQLTNSIMYGFQSRKMAESNFYYDGSGKLVKKEASFDMASGINPVWSYSYTDYTYGLDGRISEEKNYIKQNNAWVLASKVKPTYDGNGRITISTLYLPNDVAVLFRKYQYNSKDNIVLQEEYRYNNSVAELQFKYNYDSFDDKLNPLINMGSAVPPFSVNKNNILKTTVTNYVATPGSPIVTSSTTVYNAYNNDGLPTKMTESGTEFTFEYQ